jgi:hypothetical protein
VAVVTHPALGQRRKMSKLVEATLFKILAMLQTVAATLLVATPEPKLKALGAVLVALAVSSAISAVEAKMEYLLKEGV